MIKGKTSSGFEFELEEDILDDYELLETLQKIDEGETGHVTGMVIQLLGEEQKEALKNHVRSVSGRVSAKRLMEEVSEIFQSCNAGKN